MYSGASVEERHKTCNKEGASTMVDQDLFHDEYLMKFSIYTLQQRQHRTFTKQLIMCQTCYNYNLVNTFVWAMVIAVLIWIVVFWSVGGII